jgi:hypothetical protein
LELDYERQFGGKFNRLWRSILEENLSGYEGQFHKVCILEEKLEVDCECQQEISKWKKKIFHLRLGMFV